MTDYSVEAQRKLYIGVNALRVSTLRRGNYHKPHFCIVRLYNKIVTVIVIVLINGFEQIQKQTVAIVERNYYFPKDILIKFAHFFANRA